MKIAVIEDHLPVRRLLCRRAESEAGATIVAQASGEDEAVDAVMSTRPDVVLLDLRLAQGNGLDVLARLRRQSYTGQVLVLSSDDRAVAAPLCVSRGANGYYDKAFDFEQLLVDLNELARRDAANAPSRRGARGHGDRYLRAVNG